MEFVKGFNGGKFNVIKDWELSEEQWLHLGVGDPAICPSYSYLVDNGYLRAS